MTSYNLGGNSFFLACHSALVILQTYFGVRYRTWGFLFGMFCGHTLEIIGYVARVKMHFGENQFLMYIATLTIGPTFFSAAVYLCLARIIAVYGEHFSRFSPRAYTITFMVSDFVALILQASRGAILGGSDISASKRDAGLAIIKTGLAAHLVAMGIFVGLAFEFGCRVYRARDGWNSEFGGLQRSPKFKTFLIYLPVATIAIFVRTAYRVAELSKGFNSPLARNETVFMILEGAVIAIATISLSIGHPGPCFEGRWGEANFELRKRGRSGTGESIKD